MCVRCMYVCVCVEVVPLLPPSLPSSPPFSPAPPPPLSYFDDYVTADGACVDAFSPWNMFTRTRVSEQHYKILVSTISYEDII